MKLRLPLLFALLSVLVPSIRAQQQVSLETMKAALQFRADLAEMVGGNEVSPADALKQLRKAGGASGLNLAQDADYGTAALDIGHRLLALKRPDAAEVFFRAAEDGFQLMASRTSRTQAKEKAEYLRKLAQIRGNFLNKPAQAKADIDEAIQLQPDDKSLEETRRVIARGRSEHFKETRKN